MQPSALLPESTPARALGLVPPLPLGLLVALALLVAPALLIAPSPAPAQDAAASDPAAVAAAEQVLESMGGRGAWDATRYLKWRFLGRRLHHWDRFTGDVRIESDDLLVLMNIHSRKGRAFAGGEEITDPEARAEALESGYAWWVNDAYWLIMPYKLLDPGTRLADAGESALEDGRAARKLVLTFEGGTGLTPSNKYEVWIAAETGLVEQWAYYADASDPEPRFTGPWTGWEAFGDPPIRLATSRGRGADWEIEVPAELPRELFERP